MGKSTTTTNLLTSISNLSNGGNLDVDALKNITREIVSYISETKTNSDFLEKQLTFVFDLLVYLGIINEQQKNNYIDDLRLNYNSENESINDFIITSSRDLTEEQKESIRRNSLFKGLFTSLAELEEKYPPTRAGHNWRAIVSPENHEDIWRRGELQEYLFSVDTMSWIPVNDPSYFRNYQERVDPSIPGREKGLPLNLDLAAFVKEEYKWKTFTREELDLASKEILEFLISSLLETQDNLGRIKSISKTDADNNRLDRLKKETSWYKEFMKDTWLVSHKSFSDIIYQINTDYSKKIKILLDDGSTTNGMKRPQLIRNNFTKVIKTIDGQDVEVFEDDYDENGLINKNIDNPTVENLLKVVNYDFNRKHIVPVETIAGEWKTRINTILPDASETSIKKDPLVPKNISSSELNKLITQINNDYFNVVPAVPTETYNSFLTSFVNSYITDSTLRVEIISRLSKSGNIIKSYINGPVESKNKTITYDVLNTLISNIKDCILKIAVNSDEIFERNNTFNGDKTFTGKTVFSGVKNTFNNGVYLDKELDVSGKVVFRNNVSFLGNEVFFANVNKLLNVQTPTVVYRDPIIELNRPTVAEGEPIPTAFQTWIDQVNNGYSGHKVFRGLNTSYRSFFYGYAEDRKALVAGYLDKDAQGNDVETEEKIKSFRRIPWINDNLNSSMEGRSVLWKNDTQSFEATTDLWADLEGCYFHKFVMSNANIATNLITVGKFVTLISGNLFVSDLSSHLKADSIGFVRKITPIPSSTNSLVEVVLGGVTPYNNAYVSGTTLYLQPNGTINNSYSYVDDSTYFVKTVGKVISDKLILIKIDKTENYKSFAIDNMSETDDENYNAELNNTIILPTKYTRLTPLNLTSGGYNVYSYSVHKDKIIGFAEDLGSSSILLSNKDKIYFANSLLYPVGTVLYLNTSNQITSTVTKVKIGSLVSANQILIDIYVEPEIVVTEVLSNPVIETDFVNSKTVITLSVNNIIELNFKEHEIYEVKSLNTSDLSFNSFYFVLGEDSMTTSSIHSGGNLGTFYLDYNGAEHKVKYKALVSQKLTINDVVSYTSNASLINVKDSINQ